jgi:hypothetical protein
MTGHETTNERDETMNGFKIMGMAEEGKCEHCGANCPKRRVYVMPVDADGNHAGDVQCWGVICASKVRGDKGTATDVKYLSRFARHVDRIREVVSAGGGYREIYRATIYGYPFNIANGVVQIWSHHRPGKPDAEIPMPATA